MALNLSLSSVLSMAIGSGGGFGLPARERGGDGFDVVDLLPDDPFEMKAGSAWSAAVAGLIENLNGQYVSDGLSLNVQHSYFGGCSGYWTSAWFSQNGGYYGGSNGYFIDGGFVDRPGFLPCAISQGGILGSDLAFERRGVDSYKENVCSERASYASQNSGFVWGDLGAEQTCDAVGMCSSEAEVRCAEESSGGGGNGLPHDGMLFALGCLDVHDLLAAEMVCKTFRSAIRDDPSLWRCIHISQPLNDRLTDDMLLQLSKRANGSLQCLRLVDCRKITDDGLKRVLEANCRITKLNLHGCNRVTVEGLVDCFKMFKTPDRPGVQHLMISGIRTLSDKHYEDLISLLDLDVSRQSKALKPQFYHVKNHSASCDYDRHLDVELCQKCQCWRLLYDCPAESCRSKISEPCRACRICIPRCIRCGRCLIDDEYEETFSLDYICSICVNHLCKTQEGYEASFGKRAPLSPLLPVSGSNEITEEPAAD